MMAAIGPRQEGRFPNFLRPKKAKKSAPPPPLARRAASGPFLTRAKLGHTRGDLFNSFDRRLT
ncbi:hypothetical protein C7W88_21890 (plasmid) [Novosphingobium sp. THN1]|uniref:hypothetical protein n=1 Tax=Novosphingobium sp. THN1 TaxID=1016987 RepID=UPI000E46811E|nr:hypothetical protein [Novosphingobium sp. THN1]AXU21487.1 hypothetical protein C7W88_21890 [Novosphingobium sp. THN1]